MPLAATLVHRGLYAPASKESVKVAQQEEKCMYRFDFIAQLQNDTKILFVELA